MWMLFIFNLGLLYAMLIAPVTLGAAFYYRKSAGTPVFIWSKRSMVPVTIVAFLITLALFIVGISCFFSYLGYLPAEQFSLAQNQLLIMGASCFLYMLGTVIVYFAIKKINVHLILEEGIVKPNASLFKPNLQNAIRWSYVVDYYIKNDYPNSPFTFITNQEGGAYSRITLPVPFYYRGALQAYLDQQLEIDPYLEDDNTEISRRNFFEN